MFLPSTRVIFPFVSWALSLVLVFASMLCVCSTKLGIVYCSPHTATPATVPGKEKESGEEEKEDKADEAKAESSC